MQDKRKHRLNHYLEEKYLETYCAIHWIVIYQMDSVIQLFNNLGQFFFFLFMEKGSVAEFTSMVIALFPIPTNY